MSGGTSLGGTLYTMTVLYDKTNIALLLCWISGLLILPSEWQYSTRPAASWPLCTEKQARAAVYILTRNTAEHGLKSEPKNKATSTRKCMLENWDLTMTIEVATATKRCVETC